MRVFTDLGDVPADFGPSAITFGKFDGVHRGHEQVIARLREEARAESLLTTVVTFDRNPLSVLAPESCPEELISNAQKLELLESIGVDVTVMLEFNRAFSENSPRQFVEDMLVNILNAKVVLVGADVRFGRRGAGNLAVLRELGDELGFRVELLETFTWPDPASHEERRVSSTWVRERLSSGDVAGAVRLLGHDHVVRSTVVSGAGAGGEFRDGTVRLAPEREGFVPAEGIYAAWAVVEGIRYRAEVSVGTASTPDGGSERPIEAHLVSADDEKVNTDLQGKTIEIHFVAMPQVGAAVAEPVTAE